MASIKSSDSNDSMSRVVCDPEGEWKVIASFQVRDTGRNSDLTPTATVKFPAELGISLVKTETAVE